MPEVYAQRTKPTTREELEKEIETLHEQLAKILEESSFSLFLPTLNYYLTNGYWDKYLKQLEELKKVLESSRVEENKRLTPQVEALITKVKELIGAEAPKEEKPQEPPKGKRRRVPVPRPKERLKPQRERETPKEEQYPPPSMPSREERGESQRQRERREDEEEGTTPRVIPQTTLHERSKEAYSGVLSLLFGISIFDDEKFDTVWRGLSRDEKNRVEEAFRQTLQCIARGDRVCFRALVEKYGGTELAEIAGEWWDKYHQYVKPLADEYLNQGTPRLVEGLLEDMSAVRTFYEQYLGPGGRFVRVQSKEEFEKVHKQYDEDLNKLISRKGYLQDYLSLYILQQYGLSDVKDLEKLLDVKGDASSRQPVLRGALAVVDNLLKKIESDEEFFNERQRIVSRWNAAEEFYQSLDIGSMYRIAKFLDEKRLYRIQQNVVYTVVEGGKLVVKEEREEMMENLFKVMATTATHLTPAGSIDFFLMSFPLIIATSPSYSSVESALRIVSGNVIYMTGGFDSWYGRLLVRDYVNELPKKIVDSLRNNLDIMLTQLRKGAHAIPTVQHGSQLGRDMGALLASLNETIKYLDRLERDLFIIRGENVLVRLQPIDIFGKGDPFLFVTDTDKEGTLGITNPLYDAALLFRRDAHEILPKKEVPLQYLSPIAIDWFSTLSPSRGVARRSLSYMKYLEFVGKVEDRGGALAGEGGQLNGRLNYVSPKVIAGVEASGSQKGSEFNAMVHIAQDSYLKNWEARGEFSRVKDKNLINSLELIATQGEYPSNVVLYADEVVNSAGEVEQRLFVYYRVNKGEWIRLGYFTAKGNENITKLMTQFRYNARAMGTHIEAYTNNGRLVGGILALRIGTNEKDLGLGVAFSKQDAQELKRVIISLLSGTKEVEGFRGRDVTIIDHQYAMLYFADEGLEGYEIGGRTVLENRGILSGILLDKIKGPGLFVKTTMESYNFVLTGSAASYLEENVLNKGFSFGSGFVSGDMAFYLMGRAFVHAKNEGERRSGGFVASAELGDRFIRYGQLSYTYEDALAATTTVNKDFEELRNAVDEVNRSLNDLVTSLSLTTENVENLLNEIENGEYKRPLTDEEAQTLRRLRDELKNAQAPKSPADVVGELYNYFLGSLIGIYEGIPGDEERKNFYRFLLQYVMGGIDEETFKQDISSLIGDQNTLNDVLTYAKIIRIINESVGGFRAGWEGESFNKYEEVRDPFASLVQGVARLRDAERRIGSRTFLQLQRFWGVKLVFGSGVLESLVSILDHNAYLLLNGVINLENASVGVTAGTSTGRDEYLRLRGNTYLRAIDMLAAAELYRTSYEEKGWEASVTGVTLGLSTPDIYGGGTGHGFMILGSGKNINLSSEDLSYLMREVGLTLGHWNAQAGLFSPNSQNEYLALLLFWGEITGEGDTTIKIKGRAGKFGIEKRYYDVLTGRMNKQGIKVIYDEHIYKFPAPSPELKIWGVGGAAEYELRYPGWSLRAMLEFAHIEAIVNELKTKGYRIKIDAGGRLVFTQQ